MDKLDTGQKLYRLQDSQNDDGTVNLEIDEWYEEDNTVHFHFIDPLGEEHTVSCNMPRSMEEDNFFNDVLEHTGWEYSTAEGNLEGEKIPAKPADVGYDILPEILSRWERIRKKINKLYFRDSLDGMYNKREPSFLAKCVMAIGHPLVVIFIAIDRMSSSITSNTYNNGWMDGILATWLYIILFILLLILL